MLIELVPPRRSISLAPQSGGGLIMRYERGNTYEVDDAMGRELLRFRLLGRPAFQLSSAPVVDQNAEALADRAGALIGRLASMGPGFLEKLESLFDATYTATGTTHNRSPSGAITTKDIAGGAIVMEDEDTCDDVKVESLSVEELVAAEDRARQVLDMDADIEAPAPKRKTAGTTSPSVVASPKATKGEKSAKIKAAQPALLRK